MVDQHAEERDDNITDNYKAILHTAAHRKRPETGNWLAWMNTLFGLWCAMTIFKTYRKDWWDQGTTFRLPTCTKWSYRFELQHIEIPWNPVWHISLGTDTGTEPPDMESVFHSRQISVTRLKSWPQTRERSNDANIAKRQAANIKHLVFMVSRVWTKELISHGGKVGWLISMVKCKTAVGPMLMHWNHCSFALSFERLFMAASRLVVNFHT